MSGQLPLSDCPIKTSRPGLRLGLLRHFVEFPDVRADSSQSNKYKSWITVCDNYGFIMTKKALLLFFKLLVLDKKTNTVSGNSLKGTTLYKATQIVWILLESNPRPVEPKSKTQTTNQMHRASKGHPAMTLKLKFQVLSPLSSELLKIYNFSFENLVLSLLRYHEKHMENWLKYYFLIGT